MKLISWNVNGLRAVMSKGFMGYFEAEDADVFALQETKLQPDQIELELPGYEQYWNSALKKGYSGTAVFTKQTPLSVSYDFEGGYDNEGRVITLEFDEFYFVNAYSPNSQRDLVRLPFRMDWENAFRAHLCGLDAQKPVVVCGDLNVAHTERDLKNPKTNRMNAGFTDQERQKMTELLGAGFIDTFRHLYPDRLGAYTWWSYMYNARVNNAGWRIDYFLCSDRLKSKIQESIIYADTIGSDHCPVGIILG